MFRFIRYHNISKGCLQELYFWWCIDSSQTERFSWIWDVGMVDYYKKCDCW